MRDTRQVAGPPQSLEIIISSQYMYCEDGIPWNGAFHAIKCLKCITDSKEIVTLEWGKVDKERILVFRVVLEMTWWGDKEEDVL